MIIDVGALLILVVMGYQGRVTGAAYQLVRLVVLVVAALLAYAVGREMAIFHLSTAPELDPKEAATYWFFICFGILWLLGSLLANRLAGSARDASIDRTGGDQFGGVLLGATRGFAIAFMLVIGMWAQYQTQERFKFDYHKSHLAKFAIPKSFIQKQTLSLRDYLEEHYTTDAEEPEDQIKFIGNLPKDERSVLP